VKILHTADWHAGRFLHGVDRTPEIREVLREIAEVAQREAVDLILVAGDLFDTRNPGADAEEAVYEFFLTTGRARIPSVVVAGNHDSPSRLEAIKHLLKLANVHVIGNPVVSKQGGTFELHLNGEVARIAALPFVSERRIIKVAELLESDPGQWLEKYQEGMRKLIANLTAPFDNDAVNLLITHLTTDGATLSQSEYSFHCTETYALKADVFPESLNYVALGHIHKSQRIKEFEEYRGRYSGSILQLDFGEQSDTKYVYIIEATAGKTNDIKEIPLTSGKRLKRFNFHYDELERRTSDLQDFPGYLKLVLTLDKSRPGLKERIKQAIPNVLAIEFEIASEETQGDTLDLEKMTLLEAYAQFYQQQKTQGLPDDLRDAFKELYDTDEVLV
jgi:DNA repair protein SbcD/Mre11